MQENEDFYKALQLQPTARPKAIRAAYRRLRRPYESGDGDPDDAEAMERLTRAFDTLIDPKKRAEHDRQRADERPSKTGSGADGLPAQSRAVDPTRAGGGGVASPLLEGPRSELLAAVVVVVLLTVTGAVLFSIISN
jgi:DnaJ-class molecular chaperone